MTGRDPLPDGVTWDPDTHTLAAGASAAAGTLTRVIVWGVRILALLVGVIVLVGGAVLEDGPPWWVLAVVVLVWVASGALGRAESQRDAAWRVQFSPAGIEWESADAPRGGVAWAHVEALRPVSRWSHAGSGANFESRWLEVLQRDGTVHRLPPVMTADRYLRLIEAAQAHRLVPPGVRIEPPERR